MDEEVVVCDPSKQSKGNCMFFETDQSEMRQTEYNTFQWRREHHFNTIQHT